LHINTLHIHLKNSHNNHLNNFVSLENATISTWVCKKTLFSNNFIWWSWIVVLTHAILRVVDNFNMFKTQQKYEEKLLRFIWSYIRSHSVDNNHFNFFLKVLLTPPDEGPRIKGQRIKLQDIIEGMYHPLNSNNGCWISCKYFTLI
jgi:hypothetical protein